MSGRVLHIHFTAFYDYSLLLLPIVLPIALPIVHVASIGFIDGIVANGVPAGKRR